MYKILSLNVIYDPFIQFNRTSSFFMPCSYFINDSTAPDNVYLKCLRFERFQNYVVLYCAEGLERTFMICPDTVGLGILRNSWEFFVNAYCAHDDYCNIQKEIFFNELEMMKDRTPHQLSIAFRSPLLSPE